MAATTPYRYTPEDLLAITDRPTPELVDGQLVEREMGQKADAVSARVSRLLGNHVSANRLGLVNGSQCGYQIFADDPDKVRFPKVSFTRKERLPQPLGATGHARVAPDLAVEVISPHDNASDLIIKLREYLVAGVRLIWVAYPDDCSLQVFKADGTGLVLGSEGLLDGGEVLPGFQCQVAEFFEECQVAELFEE
jgi:Uma2 family endonuclease